MLTQAETAVEAARAAHASICEFVDEARDPVLLEPGEEQFQLGPDSFLLEWRSGRLMLQVWDDRRNVARRITGVRERRPDRLELVTERFGKREGQMTLMDRARARPALERRGERLVFREQFRRFLLGHFPGWTVAELSTEPNLQESLSPVYARGLLRRGTSALAAIGAPPGFGAATLTFGLIWLDYLRRRERRLTVEGLAIFLPANETRSTCLRIPFLHPRAARFLLFAYSPEESFAECIDPADWGNVETELETWPAAAPASAWVERLCRIPGVELLPRAGGAVSLRARGLEFARTAAEGLLWGVETKSQASESDLAGIERLARELLRLRSPSAEDREHPLWRRQPEAWLESVVRPRIEELDSSLLPSPVYGQVPALAGGERGIIDLLAADRAGRLAVIELKASEDIHLPLQALDYWVRVKWHLDRGEFSGRGYFPGIALRTDWPRLLLVAPALHFHPKTEVILRFFAPGVDVERIGLSAEWRQELRIMFRLRGSDRPR